MMYKIYSRATHRLIWQYPDRELKEAIRIALLREADLRGADLPNGCCVIQASRDLLFYPGLEATILHIGCERRSIGEWVERAREIGKIYNYSEEQIDEYVEYINLIATRLSKKGLT